MSFLYQVDTVQDQGLLPLLPPGIELLLEMFWANIMALREEIGFTDSFPDFDDDKARQQADILAGEGLFSAKLDDLLENAASGSLVPVTTMTLSQLQEKYKNAAPGTICGVLCFADGTSLAAKMVSAFTCHPYSHTGLIVCGEQELEYLDAAPGVDRRQHGLQSYVTAQYRHGCVLDFVEVAPKLVGGQDPDHTAHCDRVIKAAASEMHGPSTFNMDMTDIFMGFIGRSKLKAHRRLMWCSEFVADILQRSKILNKNRLPHGWAPCHFGSNTDSFCEDQWRLREPCRLVMPDDQ